MFRHFSSIALLLVACIAGCNESRIEPETESRIEPTPADIDEDDMERVNYDELAPHEQRLLTAMKEGRLEGADASSYKDDLAKADEIKWVDGKTSYFFELIPADGPSEGPPLLLIQVQDKYGHIILCIIAFPAF